MGIIKIIFQSNQFRTENLVLHSESHKNTEKKSKFLIHRKQLILAAKFA